MNVHIPYEQSTHYHPINYTHGECEGCVSDPTLWETKIIEHIMPPEFLIVDDPLPTAPMNYHAFNTSHPKPCPGCTLNRGMIGLPVDPPPKEEQGGIQHPRTPAQKAEFLKYIRETLLPDLRNCDRDATADDIEELLEIIHQQDDLITKVKRMVDEGMAAAKATAEQFRK